MQSMQEKFYVRGLVYPNEKQNYQVLTKEDIVDDEIHEQVRQIKEIIGDVPAEDCQKLLYDFQWNCEKLLESFSDADSYDDFLEKNKIDLHIPLTPHDMINSFIESNPLFRSCPNKSKKCKEIVKINSSEVDEIICKCNFRFCYKCDKTPHSPFPCILIKEWQKQCDEYDFIFNHYNCMCPKCFEVYDVEWQGVITCLNCSHTFSSLQHDLTNPWIYKEYKYCLDLEEKQGTITKLKIHATENVEFITTVSEVIKNILQKIYSLPILSFFLDKEYLSKNPSPANIQIFEFGLNDLKKNLDKLMNVLEDKIIESKDKNITVSWISEAEQDKILDDLFIIQKQLEKLLNFAQSTKGWVFKIPEIQVVFDKIYEENNDGVDEIEEGILHMNDARSNKTDNINSDEENANYEIEEDEKFEGDSDTNDTDDDTENSDEDVEDKESGENGSDDVIVDDSFVLV